MHDRQYPLRSLRDWRAEAERSQERANEQREHDEPFVQPNDWLAAIPLAFGVLLLLVLLKAVLG
jgi:hypothetical protein